MSYARALLFELLVWVARAFHLVAPVSSLNKSLDVPGSYSLAQVSSPAADDATALGAADPAAPEPDAEPVDDPVAVGVAELHACCWA